VNRDVEAPEAVGFPNKNLSILRKNMLSSLPSSTTTETKRGTIMKKLFTCLVIILFSTPLACSSKQKQTTTLAPIEECNFPDDGATNAPLWVCEVPVEGVAISAVGSAEKTGAGYDFQKTMAVSSGREQLAQQMRIKVNQMIDRYIGTTGGADSETVDKVQTSVSRQITSETLIGSKPLRTQKNSNTGTLFMLVGLDPASMSENVKNAVKTSMKNDQALWQQFLAQKKQDELAAEIAKMP
jgi:hypothetical protein